MGSQQLFCLRWSNHQMNMLSVFDQLLQSEALVDVTLACEGLSFRAHKVVLSACSPYFQSLFMENPCKHPIVILKDIKYSDLRALVDFMYKGEVNVTQEQLSALLKTAETLKVKGLAEMTSSNNMNNEGSISSSSSVIRESTSASNTHSGAAIPPLSDGGGLHPALQQSVHHRTGSPLPKRKKTRHHAQPSSSHHVMYRPPSSREASLDGDDSLDIQGSPEVIETKVEMPSDGFMPERAADQDSQMVDEHQNENEENENENDSHVKVEYQEETKPSTFQNATTSASGTSLNKNNNSSSNSSSNNANPCSEPTSPPLPCSLPAAPPPTTTSSSSMPPSLPSTSGTQPSTSQGLKPLDFVLNDPYWLDRPPAKLAITLARKCIFGDEVLKQSNLTARNNMKPLDHEKMELIKTQSRNAPDAHDTDDSLDMSPLHHPNNSSSVIEAIGSHLFGRYAPLTILPINPPIGSVRLEPSSPSSNNSSSSSNPKRGQPRILNEEEENLIVHYILDMAARGKPVTRKCVLEYGNMLLRRQDRVPTGSIHCNPEKGLSNDWWKEFKKRHPGLPFRLPVTPNS